MAYLIANEGKGNRVDWHNFVDGVILIFTDSLVPKKENRLKEFDRLTKSGFRLIVEYFKNPKFQDAVVNRNQIGSDAILFDGLNQTQINAEVLSTFRQIQDIFVLSHKDVQKLRESFLNHKKGQYNFLQGKTNEPIIQKKKYKDGASTKKLALLLYFKNEKPYNHDFDKIATEYGYKNGKKLADIFSIITEPIRRYKNSSELRSQIQKKNRINDYRWAIERLPEEKKKKANEEMKTLIASLSVEE